MTLHELLATVGIHRPVDLAKRLEISRQYASLIWTGQQPLSRKMSQKIAERTGLDARQLLIADVPRQVTTPKGRPKGPKSP